MKETEGSIVAKKVETAAMVQASKEAIEKVEITHDGQELFQIAKQRTKEGHKVFTCKLLQG